MLTQFVVAGLNRLLQDAPWGRARLAPFSGHIAALHLPGLSLHLGVDAEGYFSEASSDTPAEVEITLPASAFSGLSEGPEGVLRKAELRGSADFAETLGFVLRNLSWDYEETLSRFVGDIAAHRIAQGLHQFALWQREAASNLAQNIGEFLADERPVLTRPRAVADFARTVGELREALSRLEARVERLEKRDQPRPAPAAR